MLKLATVFSGIGAIEHALDRMHVDHEIVFACDNGDVELEMPSHKDVLTALRGTSKYYGAFIGEIECYSARVTKYLNAFNMIKQTTVLPLLFRVFDDYEARNIDENTLCSVLECLLTYFVKAINFNGSEIYVSTQFFDSDRDAVIDWYRSHL